MHTLVKTVNHGTTASSPFAVLTREDDATCVDTRFLMLRSLISLTGTASEVMCVAMHDEDTAKTTAAMMRDIVIVQGLHQAATERIRALGDVHLSQLGTDTTRRAESLLKVFGGSLPASDETVAAWSDPSSCRMTSLRVTRALQRLLNCAVSPGSVCPPDVVVLWSYLIESVVHVLQHVVASRGLLDECAVLMRILLYTARLWIIDDRVSSHLSLIMMAYLDACERVQAAKECDNIINAISGGWDLLRRLCDKHDLLRDYEKDEKLCVCNIRATVMQRIFGVVVSLRVENVMAFGPSPVSSTHGENLGSIAKTFAKSARLLREAGYHSAEIDAEAFRRVSSPSAFSYGDSHFSPPLSDVADEWEDFLRRKTADFEHADRVPAEDDVEDGMLVHTEREREREDSFFLV